MTVGRVVSQSHTIVTPPPSKKRKAANEKVLYTSDCPAYPRGVLFLVHQGECNKTFATCNNDFTWSPEGTLKEILDDELRCTAGSVTGVGLIPVTLGKEPPTDAQLEVRKSPEMQPLSLFSSLSPC